MVSDDGQVKNSKSNRILKQWTQRGYSVVNLCIDGKKKNFLVHRLVGECFIPNFNPDLTVHHIDGIRHNNHISNLENITPLDNNKERIFVGRYLSDIEFIIKVIEHHNNKLTPEEIFKLIREECK
jgi:hypothetical protein